MQNNIADHLYASTVARIAQGRKKTPKQVKALIDDGPYTAARAQKAGLVDHVMHYDEFETYLRRTHGTRVRIVPAHQFAADARRSWGPRPKVGVLYIVGTITDGPSTTAPLIGMNTTGSDSIVKAAEAFARNSAIKAVVVRIDSPGGSVTASDAMWYALSKLAKAKPLYVSMGDMAASGGYYAAVPGRGIYAMDDTITGSIGVFTGKFDISGLYKKLGVNIVEYRRGKHSGLLAPNKPWTASQRKAVQRSITAMYDLFLKRILESRPQLKEKSLRAVAAGRVWLGSEAKKHTLIDHRGGLLDAIDAAARAAQLDRDEYDFAIGPRPSGMFALPKTPLGLFKEHSSFKALLEAVPAVLKPLVGVWSQPILRFPSGTYLALFPWTVKTNDGPELKGN